MERREFLKLAGSGALVGALPTLALAANTFAHGSAIPSGAAARSASQATDYSLRIGRSTIELAPGQTVSTQAFNGQFPGPLLRLKAGRKVALDFHNDTDVPEQVHWHGQFVSDDIDGAAEERTPFIPAHGMRREVFVPGPAGFRFYHTHLRAGGDLSRGQYSGLVGPVYIESANEQGAYDREVFLTLKEFEPSLSKGGDMAQDFLSPTATDPHLKQRGEAAMKASLAKGMPKGFEVNYRLFSINGKMLGHGEPIRVKHGERVLFHILNGSATEIRSLALPGHAFKVIALDGNPVPNPATVPVLWIGTAERVSAIVEMNNPGAWILGDLSDDDRKRGMGIVIEYAGATGEPKWRKPAPFKWDYRRFADARRQVQKPDELIALVIAKDNAAEHGFNRWTLNGVAFNNQTMPVMRKLALGKRYRLRLHNASDDIHPVHLHRNTFELTRIADRPTAGVMKDIAMLGGYQSMDIDFTAKRPGLTLFHCHQQLHMDFGFMALFDCV